MCAEGVTFTETKPFHCVENGTVGGRETVNKQIQELTVQNDLIWDFNALQVCKDSLILTT